MTLGDLNINEKKIKHEKLISMYILYRENESNKTSNNTFLKGILFYVVLISKLIMHHIFYFSNKRHFQKTFNP